MSVASASVEAHLAQHGDQHPSQYWVDADGDAAVHPGADEACADGVDDDCDGTADDGCGGACPCFTAALMDAEYARFLAHEPAFANDASEVCDTNRIRVDHIESGEHEHDDRVEVWFHGGSRGAEVCTDATPGAAMPAPGAPPPSGRTRSTGPTGPTRGPRLSCG